MSDNKKPKHENQWKIDRAYNILDNEEKTTGILKMIASIESGKVSEEEGLEAAVNEGLFSSPHRYIQSTQTLLKSFGLIYDRFKLCEISKLYISNEISFGELILQQTIKKEFGEEGERVHPLIVITLVLNELDKLDSEYAYLTQYDYFYHLIEITSYNDISERALQIIEDKKQGKKNTGYEKKDFDIWFNLFTKLNILEKRDTDDEDKYIFSESNIEFINLIIEKYREISFIASDSDTAVLKEHGAIKGGVMDMLPTFKSSSESEISDSDITVIYSYLIDGKSHREIDEEFFNTKTQNGMISWGIIDKYGLNDYKGKLLPFKNYFKLLLVKIKYGITEIHNTIEEGDFVIVENEEPVSGGKNIIYYGIPGCGKSYKAHEYAKGITTDSFIFNTTFHLDYSNSDFVGQIIPSLNDGAVVYTMSPGPFTLALKSAISNPTEKVVLIIDEINRGNAAAIFGDVFQLLDRNAQGKSEYMSNNSLIIDYLKQQNIDLEKVYIPSNLHIIATMNTSDQNVFPLDTAFKRRWSMKKVDNERASYHNYYVPFDNGKITWGNFLSELNHHIIESDELEYTQEDKQLGYYFIDENYLMEEYDIDSSDFELKRDMFIHKIIEYIWSDVSKFNRDKWFEKMCGRSENRCPKTFDELQDVMKENGLSVLKVEFEYEEEI